MSAADPKKQAMPMTMIQSGFSMRWESVVVRLATGRLETRDDSDAEGMGPRTTEMAYDTALVLLMRGRHNCRRLAIKPRNSPSRADVGLPVAYYSRNGRARSADSN